jgi:hypothetical protein
LRSSRTRRRCWLWHQRWVRCVALPPWQRHVNIARHVIDTNVDEEGDEVEEEAVEEEEEAEKRRK